MSEPIPAQRIVVVTGGRNFGGTSLAAFAAFDALMQIWRRHEGEALYTSDEETGACALAREWAQKVGAPLYVEKLDAERWGDAAVVVREQFLVMTAQVNAVPNGEVVLLALPGENGADSPEVQGLHACPSVYTREIARRLGVRVIDAEIDQPDEITDQQIEGLQTEAEFAGDTIQVALCRQALSGNVAARAECARAIADAAAMVG